MEQPTFATLPMEQTTFATCLVDFTCQNCLVETDMHWAMTFQSLNIEVDMCLPIAFLDFDIGVNIR